MTRAGDIARIGDDVGSIEPGRYARLVAIRKDGASWDDGHPMRYIIRVYQPEDGDFPTGEYRRTGLLFPTDWSER